MIVRSRHNNSRYTPIICHKHAGFRFVFRYLHDNRGGFSIVPQNMFHTKSHRIHVAYEPELFHKGHSLTQVYPSVIKNEADNKTWANKQ